MATGFCGSKDLVILGFSLSNLSFLVLAGFFAASVWLIFGEIKRFGQVLNSIYGREFHRQG